MEDNKISGARQGVQTMMFYYFSSLVGVVEDPKQYIATEIGKMIDLSEEQVQYVKTSIANGNKITDNLSSSIALLENMEKTGKLDLESIGIVKGILTIMKDQCVKSLAEYTEIEDDDHE